ncbi:MAG TPA: TetR family transcriptional regulator [Gaiellales bacterium]|nr:TetR family transcriptional regulator [Gaiellales bacterium]
MAEPVKPTRRYESPRRRQQAAATRAQILEAAERLFVRDGYPATSMGAVAAEAGVALKTVYVAFETKSGVLRTLWHLRLRGDEADAPVAARDWYREVLEEPDPERLLRLNARNSRRVKERAATLLGVIRDAAPADPDIAELWERIQAEFHQNQRAVVQRLHKLGALRPGLSVAAGADILWTLNHPDVWHLLVGARGWSASRYERWFADAACSELLAPA